MVLASMRITKMFRGNIMQLYRTMLLIAYTYIVLTAPGCTPSRDDARQGNDSYDTQNTAARPAGRQYGGKCVQGDCVNGTGTFMQPNGSKYTGRFKDGMPHGKGVVHLANGDSYSGEWQNDRMHGRGVYTFGPGSPSAGDRYDGEWQNDMMHGKGTYTFGPRSQFAGDRYDGDYRNGKKNGIGTDR